MSLKQCQKCGWTGRAMRQRRCKQIEQTGFRSRYYCWGRLIPIPSPVFGRPRRTTRSVTATKLTPQEEAAKKLAQAQKRVEHWVRVIGHATKALHEWERKARHYARRAAMTAAELDAERQRAKTAAQARKAAKQKAATARRGIVMSGKVIARS